MKNNTLKNIREKFRLRTRLTMFIGSNDAVCFIVGFAAAMLRDKMLWLSSYVPLLIQIIIICLAVALITTNLAFKTIFDPIEKLHKGIQKVAGGDYTVQIDAKSPVKEIQDIIDGFNLMTKELSSTEILQTDFISNVSHEIKTPINAIEGYATLLQGTDNVDDAENVYIEKILFNTKRLSNLVRDILLLSKVENQSIGVKREQYALDEQIREAIVALETKWESKEIEFDVVLDDITYTGTKSIIYQIWSNLIGNAIKFSPQGGVIKMRLFEENGSIIYYIENACPPLSEEEMKHIFDKFYQADTSRKLEGNGLGLALVKGILSKTGGDIKVKNIEGGCRFTVMLKPAE